MLALSEDARKVVCDLFELDVQDGKWWLDPGQWFWTKNRTFLSYVRCAQMLTSSISEPATDQGHPGPGRGVEPGPAC